MKLSKIVNASIALKKICNQELPLKQAYRLNMLIGQLNPHLAYFDNNREKIAELADNCDAELIALLDEDVNIDFKPIDISLSEDIKLSVLDLMYLEGFVNFIE